MLNTESLKAQTHVTFCRGSKFFFPPPPSTHPKTPMKLFATALVGLLVGVDRATAIVDCSLAQDIFQRGDCCSVDPAPNCTAELAATLLAEMTAEERAAVARLNGTTLTTKYPLYAYDVLPGFADETKISGYVIEMAVLLEQLTGASVTVQNEWEGPLEASWATEIGASNGVSDFVNGWLYSTSRDARPYSTPTSVFKQIAFKPYTKSALLPALSAITSAHPTRVDRLRAMSDAGWKMVVCDGFIEDQLVVGDGYDESLLVRADCSTDSPLAAKKPLLEQETGNVASIYAGATGDQYVGEGYNFAAEEVAISGMTIWVADNSPHAADLLTVYNAVVRLDVANIMLNKFQWWYNQWGVNTMLEVRKASYDASAHHPIDVAAATTEALTVYTPYSYPDAAPASIRHWWTCQADLDNYKADVTSS